MPESVGDCVALISAIASDVSGDPLGYTDTSYGVGPVAQLVRAGDS